MNHLEIDVRDGRLWVWGPPRDRRLAVFATVLAAERVGDAWVFEPKHERAIHELARRLAGVGEPLRSPAGRPVTIELARSLAAMLEPELPLQSFLRHAAEVSTNLDPQLVAPETLEEAAAAFESLAARLRDVARPSFARVTGA